MRISLIEQIKIVKSDLRTTRALGRARRRAGLPYADEVRLCRRIERVLRSLQRQYAQSENFTQSIYLRKSA